MYTYSWINQFQSTRPVRGATQVAGFSAVAKYYVSIHAPRTGRDPPGTIQHDHLARPSFNKGDATASKFQSTRPVRGATQPAVSIRCASADSRGFNPRAPYGARPLKPAPRRDPEVSIHAPRTGRDCFKPSKILFQSTRPVRGATLQACFNPRAPCGARSSCYSSSEGMKMGFNPRAPYGGARRAPCGARHERSERSSRYVSIHAPRAGRDLSTTTGSG